MIMDSLAKQTTAEVLRNYGGIDNNCLNAHISNFNDDIDDLSNDLIMPSYYYDKNQFKQLLSGESGLNILSLNCCSLRAKYEDIKIFVDDCLSCATPIDIICLQETWLNSGENIDYLHINGFKFIHKAKRITGHGGLGIYLRNNLEYKIINSFPQSNIFESQFVEITLSGKKIILGNIYRPPRNINDNYYLFMDELQTVLHTLAAKRCPVIIAGDYNIDLLQIVNKPAFMDIFQMIISSSFIPKITFPSRYNPNMNSCSLLDNFFVNMCDQTLRSKAGILLHKISDHLVTFINLEISFERNKPKHILIKKSDTENYESFRRELQQINLNTHLNHDIDTDPEVNYNCVSSFLSQLYEKHFPVIRKRFNKKKHFMSPWMNSRILKAINKKNDIYKRILCMDPTQPNYMELKSQLVQCNKITRASIRAAKRSYYTSYFNENSGNMMKTWAKINELLGRSNDKNDFPLYFMEGGQIITGDNNIANAFNDYFSNITNIMANNIDQANNVDIHDYLIDRPNSSFHFNTITPNDLLKATSDIKSKNSVGHDNLSTKLIKYVIQDLKDPLTIISVSGLEYFQVF